MSAFSRLLNAEGLKLRRSPALRLVWVLPLLFILVEGLFIERPFLGLKAVNPKVLATLDTVQVKMLVALWGGFFHPLMLALLPALIFRPEHRSKTWRHLHALPTPRWGIYLAKVVYSLVLSAAMLVLVAFLLWVERKVLGAMNPLLALPFHGLDIARVLGWLWLGSLPVLALYIWVADRISSLAIPVVFGLVGLLLTVALTGQDMAQPWRRDLIPWVLPYAAAEKVVHRSETNQQEAHAVGTIFQPEPDVLRLPSGKKVRTWQNVPDHVLFPPPPPTPNWLLAVFSIGAGLLLFAVGLIDARRNRI